MKFKEETLPGTNITVGRSRLPEDEPPPLKPKASQAMTMTPEVLAELRRLLAEIAEYSGACEYVIDKTRNHVGEEQFEEVLDLVAYGPCRANWSQADCVAEFGATSHPINVARAKLAQLAFSNLPALLDAAQQLADARAERDEARRALEAVVADLADERKWNWTRVISQREAADVVLCEMVERGLIEGWLHPMVKGGTGYSTYRVNGRLYGRTDEPNGAPTEAIAAIAAKGAGP